MAAEPTLRPIGTSFWCRMVSVVRMHRASQHMECRFIVNRVHRFCWFFFLQQKRSAYTRWWSATVPVHSRPDAAPRPRLQPSQTRRSTAPANSSSSRMCPSPTAPRTFCTAFHTLNPVLRHKDATKDEGVSIFAYLSRLYPWNAGFLVQVLFWVPLQKNSYHVFDLHRRLGTPYRLGDIKKAQSHPSPPQTTAVYLWNHWISLI